MDLLDTLDPYEILASRGIPLTEIDPEEARNVMKRILQEEARTGQRVDLSQRLIEDPQPLPNTEELEPFPEAPTPSPWSGLPVVKPNVEWPKASGTGPTDRPFYGDNYLPSPDDFQVTPKPTFLDKLRDLREETYNVAKQAGANAVGATLALPWNFMSVAQAPSAVVQRVLGNKTAGENSVGVAQFMADKTRQGVRDIFGVAEPKSRAQEIAALIGGSFTPAGRLTLPITGATAIANPIVTHTIESIGGPTAITDSEMNLLGGMAATSIGLLYAPSIFKMFKFGSTPRLRPVENAAPGTMAISSPVDLARTYDDVNAGVLRLAERAGVPQHVMKDIQDTFTIQTRAASTQLANSAILNGVMETPNFSFKVQVPLAKLSQATSPQLNEYLHLWDTLDDILLLRAKPGQSVGVPTVRGITSQDAINQISALEKVNPDLRAARDAYRSNLHELRRFESVGEYGTLSPSERRFENAQRGNYVPLEKYGPTQFRPGGGEMIERPDAIKSFADEVQERLRHRMENEAVGKYVDGVRKAQPELFIPVTAEQLSQNKHWNDNVVQFYRRGKLERYTTDPFIADVLKMDPYYFSSTAGQIAYSTKRLLEMGSTGELAPWFSVTSLLRNWQIGKVAAPEGLTSPSLAGSLYAIPQQLIPQASRAIAEGLDRGSAQWLTTVFGKQGVDALSTRLAQVYTDSYFAEMSAYGGARGSILQQQVESLGKLSTAINDLKSTTSSLLGKTVVGSTLEFIKPLEAYKALLQAVHNAPTFNFAAKNVGKVPTSELAAEARNLAGDPRIGGQYYNMNGTPIRFQAGTTSDAVLQMLVQGVGIGGKQGRIPLGYGPLSELGRTSVPWFNATEQGIKRIGEAYLDDPGRFVSRVWTYQILPAAAGYLYAKSLGKDPNGVDYTDYMMNRRSEYVRTMNFYIPVPGRPADEGIEFPRFHESTIASRMMEHALDHLVRSNKFTEAEDFKAAMNSFLNVAFSPPTPPLFNAFMASQGMVGQQNLFGFGEGGNAYRPRREPFDQTGSNLPVNLENTIRALGGGIGTIMGSGYAAYNQTPEGFSARLTNALKEMGKGVVQRTPVVRDIAGIKFPMSGNTLVTEELFARQHVINDLASFYKKWTDTGSKDARGRVRDPIDAGAIRTKPKSSTGGEVAQELLGDNIPGERPGLVQPEPTNPLYIQFMEEVYNKFKHDSLNTGGMGFNSLWGRYRQLSDAIQGMRNINAGNYVTWQQQIEQRPKVKAYLEENKIDTKDPVAVKNFYERKRQDAASVILSTIRKTETEFSKRLGQPFKLEMLAPYGKGLSKDASEPIFSDQIQTAD